MFLYLVSDSLAYENLLWKLGLVENLLIGAFFLGIYEERMNELDCTTDFGMRPTVLVNYIDWGQRDEYWLSDFNL